MSQLVFCNATIQEIQRVSCVAPMTLLHAATRDVEVNGYSIKKGTRIAANLTKFMNDPKSFPNPETLMPERFIDYSYGDDANSMLKLKVVGGRQINNNYYLLYAFKNHCHFK